MSHADMARSSATRSAIQRCELHEIIRVLAGAAVSIEVFIKVQRAEPRAHLVDGLIVTHQRVLEEVRRRLEGRGRCSATTRHPTSKHVIVIHEATDAARTSRHVESVIVVIVLQRRGV